MKAARVSLHRFRDCAAVAVLNSQGTVYLDAKGARQLARDMARLARSIEKESFVDSEFRAGPIHAFQSSGDITPDCKVIRKAKA